MANREQLEQAIVVLEAQRVFDKLKVDHQDKKRPLKS